MAGDHPRRCGAFREKECPCVGFSGSSPQVRGILARACHIGGALGIIPAGAGHLLPKASRSTPARDHPRRCGAFFPKRTLLLWLIGSSPQVRGIFQGKSAEDKPLGIIPAGAGHLSTTSPVCSHTQDHPRRCGAFSYRGFRGTKIPGSSPQVRGIYSLSWNIDPKYSFITPSYR